MAVIPGRRAILVTVVVCVSASLFAAAWHWQSSGISRQGGLPSAPALQDAEPERVAVHALGRLEPASRILELSPESGNEGATIRELLVREGDDVEAGAVLAVLDNFVRREASVAEARAALDAARAKLAQVKAGAKAGDIAAQEAAVALTRQQSTVVRRELDRARELHQRKALSDDDLDAKQWELDRLLIETQRGSGLLDSLREIRETDVQAAAAEVARAEAVLASAETQLAASRIHAPVAGRILRIHIRVGERPGSDGVLELGDVRQMHAVAEVFEADVSLLREGLNAEVVVDGSGVRLQGTVVEIGQLVARKVVLTNDPVSDTDARVVEVRVSLDADSSGKVARLSNARVEVTINLSED
ncbi:MAG: HlyD family efflux transporter periplasmic adaptor subunit [Planctomycetaceae bacterium]